MREIKFRVRRKDGRLIGYMRFESGRWQCQMLKAAGGSEEWSSGVLHGSTIEQYTGLKDQNSKEIYEGDILAIKFWGTYVERIYWKGPPDAIAEVFWDVAGLRLRAEGAEDKRFADFWDFMEPYHSNGLHDMNPAETAVIGNIHENPELLSPEGSK